MLKFKLPKHINISVDPYAAMAVFAYHRRTGQKESVPPTLSGLLDYFDIAILEALQKELPKIRAEHLTEQSDAQIEEMLRGIDRVWEDAIKDQEETETGGSKNKEESPPSDEWDPEHGEDWKKGTP